MSIINDFVLARCRESLSPFGEGVTGVVMLHQPDPDSLACSACGEEAPCDTMRLLARPFSAHPDYESDWKP